MHISDAGSIVQVKDENRRNTDVFQGLRTQNWAIETSQNAQIISRQFLNKCAYDISHISRLPRSGERNGDQNVIVNANIICVYYNYN